MKTIELSPSVKLPVEIAGRRTAVFGISGSGKSNTATVLVEQLLAAGEQVVMVDPKGEGWGLLSLANGKPSNLDIVAFGEPNGHIETLAETHGPRLADFVVETGRSVILSLLGFESDQSERRFVASFLRQLYRRKSREGSPSRTLVVLEEAHLFVPEHATGDKTELAGAVQRIVRQGRSCGIGTLLVDQRPQDVSKRVVTQCDTLICHQLSHNLDRKALAEWVQGFDTGGRGKLFLDSLASLKPGEAWIWSPAWRNIFERAQVNRRQTFDTGAAPDGKTAKAVKRAEVDLDALSKQLTEIVEKAKADDPKELKKRIKELEALTKSEGDRIAKQSELLSKKAEGKVTIERVEVPVLKDGQLARAEKLVDRMQKLMNDARGVYEPLATAVGKVLVQPKPVPPTITPKVKTQIQDSHKPARPISSPGENGSRPSTNGDIPKGERSILTACAQYPEGCDRSQLTVLTGYKRSSRDAYIQRLREKGYVTVSGDMVLGTEVGVSALGDFEPLPTGDELREYWMRRLPQGEREILKVVCKDYPASVDREIITEATNYQRSSRDAYIQRLAAKKLVVPGRGDVTASETLFS